jgi:hypothetical protein
MLDGSCVLSIVHELVTCGVTEHVRVSRKGQPSHSSGAGYDLPYRGRANRPLPLRRKHERSECLRLQLPESLHFSFEQRVSAGAAVLTTADVKQSLIEINLVPAQRTELANAQPVAVRNGEHCAVAKPVAPDFASCID